MNEFIGFDRENLQLLRDTMRHAATGLGQLNCADPEAWSAVQAVRSAHVMLEQRWIPRIDAVLAGEVLSGYVPATIPAGDLAHSALYELQRHGWQITTDPSATWPHQLQSIEAETLAERLVALSEAEHEYSPAELDELRTMLTLIAQRPALVDAFLTHMTSASWVALCNTVATSHYFAVRDQLEYRETGDDTASASAEIFAALGAILVDDHHRHPDSNATVLTDVMEPYAAALLVQHLELSAAQLATTAAGIITRAPAPPASVWDGFGPTIADILMTTMLETPEAPAQYVAMLVDSPELLLGTSADTELIDRFLTTATDPTNMDAHAAGSVLDNLLEFVTSGAAHELGRDAYAQPPAYGQIMVDLVSPWMLQFTFAARRDWPIGPERSVSLLLALLHDEGAFAAMIARRDAVLAPVAASGNVGDLACLLGLIDTLIWESAINTAESAQAVWNLTWTLIGITTAFVPGLGTAASTAVDIGVAGLQQALTKLGAGPDATGDVAHDTLMAMDWQTTFAAAGVVLAIYGGSVLAGTLPAGTPPPPQVDPQWTHPSLSYSVAFREWLSQPALQGANGELNTAGQALEGAKQKVLSDRETQGTLVESSNG